MAGARMYLALVTVAVLCFTTILAQTDLEITAVDQTSMANGNQAYLVIYQKCLDPYPDYVAIFDERILGTKGENIFYISPQLTVGAAYVQQNGYSQFGSAKLTNTSGNYSLTFEPAKKVPTFNILPDTALPGYIVLNLAENLPLQTTGAYTMFLSRSGNAGDLRQIVPFDMLNQPPGEIIFVKLPPATSWYMAVATKPLRIGQSVHHSLLPPNEVPINAGQTAVVTGNLRVGFTITVGY